MAIRCSDHRILGNYVLQLKDEKLLPDYMPNI